MTSPRFGELNLRPGPTLSGSPDPAGFADRRSPASSRGPCPTSGPRSARVSRPRRIRRLLRPRPRTPHRRRAHPGGPPGHGPNDPRGPRPARHRATSSSPSSGPGVTTSLSSGPAQAAGFEARAGPSLRPPSSSASPPIPATRPTTPTWRPSIAPRSTASACSIPPAEPDYARTPAPGPAPPRPGRQGGGAPLPGPRTSQHDHAEICKPASTISSTAKTPLLIARRARLGRRDPRTTAWPA